MRTNTTQRTIPDSMKGSKTVLSMRAAMIALAIIGIVATLIGTPNKSLNPSGALCIHSPAGKSK